jgi:hypothetical protein
MNELGAPIGEVIASKTSLFIAALAPRVETGVEKKSPVAFGSLVAARTGEINIFGIVSMIEHLPTESNRKVSPHGKTKAELRREMPQVFTLLQTEFSALVVGYTRNGLVSPSLPLVPPDLHDFVYPASESDLKQFFKRQPAYIRLILNSYDVMPDELIVAFLRTYLGVMTRQELVSVGKELSYLLGDDHQRLESILTRIYD